MIVGNFLHKLLHPTQTRPQHVFEHQIPVCYIMYWKAYQNMSLYICLPCRWLACNRGRKMYTQSPGALRGAIFHGDETSTWGRDRCEDIVQVILATMRYIATIGYNITKRLKTIRDGCGVCWWKFRLLLENRQSQNEQTKGVFLRWIW